MNDKASLKVLKLGHNNIHSLPPECFEYLTNLETLELDNNPLSVIDQPTAISLGYLTNLKVNHSVLNVVFYDQCCKVFE